MPRKLEKLFQDLQAVSCEVWSFRCSSMLHGLYIANILVIFSKEILFIWIYCYSNILHMSGTILFFPIFFLLCESRKNHNLIYCFNVNSIVCQQYMFPSSELAAQRQGYHLVLPDPLYSSSTQRCTLKL